MRKLSILFTVIIVAIIVISVFVSHLPIVTNESVDLLVYQSNQNIYNSYYPVNSPYVVINARGTRQQNDGSGFYITSNVVATCEHILEFDNITVNGNRATVLSRNISKDIALLKVSVENTKYLKLSPITVQQGQPITVYSNPLKLNNTMSIGIISNPSRMINDERNPVIQFTAPVSAGSSGGAIINKDGEVIGMVKETISAGQLLNFAIPASQIQQELNNITSDANNEDYSNYNYYGDY